VSPMVPSDDTKQTISKALLLLQILTAVFVGTFIIFMIVPFLLELPLHEEVDRTLVLILFSIGLVEMIIFPAIVPMFFKVSASSTSADATPLQAVLSGLLTRTVLILVCRETGVILGFVASFMSGEPQWVLALGTLGIVLIIFLDWPTRSKIEHAIREALPAEERVRLGF